MRGAWTGGGSLAAYQETTWSGRTVTTTVTERGYLAPFGFSASIEATADRRFETASDGTTVVVLVPEESLAVDPHEAYPQDFMPDLGRRLPFTSVRLVPPAGPARRAQITWTTGVGVPKSIATTAIWQVADTDDNPILLEHVAIDRAGYEVHFSTGAYFVPASRAFERTNNSPLGKLVSMFSAIGPEALERRTLLLHGQPVAFADEDVPGSGVTTKDCEELRLTLSKPDGDVDTVDLLAAGQPAFFPGIGSAIVTDSTLDTLRGAPTRPPGDGAAR